MVNTSSERWQSSYTCSPKITATKLKKDLKDKQAKLKRKKAKPNGKKDSDKTLEKTNKKNT